ncbi:ATP-binding protein [Archangium lansingense]|uniref:ATP-binding response regulator n=1 Tax=Archangium lansingense TaxID=2995310 RepID=UPI003B7ED750
MQAGNAPRTSVLLVDDQPADLLAMERHLGPFSLHLVKACSGEEALHCIEDEDFALVLMDVRMPGLDGFETARLMRENTEQSHVPLIFLTGAPPEEHNLAYASGAVDWLRKPVEPEILRAKVRVFVELHRERETLRLEQVVAHLLSNALKFGAGGPVLLRVEEQEGWARLTVRDAGIGMDEKVRARIFGRFERGVSERHYGGLGLGLFITHQVVDAMGGRIHVESAPGRGSTFTVELPCSAPKEAGGGTRHDA